MRKTESFNEYKPDHLLIFVPNENTKTKGRQQWRVTAHEQERKYTSFLR